jgi:hypothetical protein
MPETKNIKNQRKCNVCKKPNAIKRTGGKCKLCALEKGYKVCRCGRIYKPKKVGQRSCGSHKVKTRSVWVSSSAGLPTLGKRK